MVVGRPSPRAGLLLACLLGALLALLDVRGLLPLGLGSTATNAETACAGRVAPTPAPARTGELRQLRLTVRSVLAPPLGRIYQEGSTRTSDLWLDDPPNAPSPGTAVAAYEVRWWALDAEGREDDVVVDAIRYGDRRRAHDALSAATDPRCHRRALLAAATAPAGGLRLSWINPDGAYQQDDLFVRGATLYRVAAVPPGLGDRPAEAAQRPVERGRLAIAVQALACSIPASGCDRSQAAGLAARAGAPALDPFSSSRGWPATAAQARAYARAVSLRPYDLPYASAVSPEVLPPQSASPRAFDRCQGRLGTPSLLASATSPVYRFRSRLDQQTFVSSAAVLPAGALARRYVEAAARPSVAACERDSLKDLIRRARSRDRRVAFTDVHLVPVTPSAPASYRDAVPYRAAGVRLKLVLVLTGHRGRRLRVPFYEQELVFLYRRAVVALIATATRTPISAATWRYLESTMVGRAEANWGHPQTSARPPAIAGHGSATAS